MRRRTKILAQDFFEVALLRLVASLKTFSSVYCQSRTIFAIASYLVLHCLAVSQETNMSRPRTTPDTNVAGLYMDREHDYFEIRSSRKGGLRAFCDLDGYLPGMEGAVWAPFTQTFTRPRTT